MRKKGFTLIELMVVLVVIAILIGITVPRFQGMRDQANISKAQGELNTIQAALESYAVNLNPPEYPSTTNTLVLDYLKDASPNIISNVLYDPFSADGNEYDYIRSDNGAYYVIFSLGVDGEATITGISDAGSITPDIGDDIFASNGYFDEDV